MKYSKLIQAIHIYNLLSKKSDIKGNMAKRIMYSALPGMFPNIMDRPDTGYTALRSLVPGAKEMVHYGAKACLNEMYYYAESSMEDIEGVKDKIEQLYDEGNFEKFFILCKRAFENSESWSFGFGGKNWALIADNLLKLHKSIDGADAAKINGDLDKEIEFLNQMVVYMNVLDGIMHNSGSLMEKMIDEQLNDTFTGDKSSTEFSNEYKKYIGEVERLMHVKELKNLDDVISEVEPILKNRPEWIAPFNNWLKKYKHQRYMSGQNDNINSDEKRDVLIKKIQFKKEIFPFIEVNIINLIKSKLLPIININDQSAKTKEIKNNLNIVNSLLNSIRFIQFKLEDQSYLQKEYLEISKIITKYNNYIDNSNMLSKLDSSRIELLIRSLIRDSYKIRDIIQNLIE